MQSLDKDNNVIQTALLDNRFSDMVSKIEQAESKGAVSHRVGRLPSKNDIVEINGLKYKVNRVDNQHSEIRLRLI